MFPQSRTVFGTSPTAPSAAGAWLTAGPDVGRAWRGLRKIRRLVSTRNDSFDFRNQLETKYQTGLGRGAAPTYVDREGEVVWTQEYMRYRINGCDHGSATQRVMAQIDGNPAGQVCGAPPDGLIAFPPRTDSFDFRRQLESRYQQFDRGFSQSTVDAEGGVIWTQEYLRYRVNQCDHPTSVQKVFSQIDGGGVAPTCFVPPCVFTVAPTTKPSRPPVARSRPIVTKASGGDCTFGAESLGSFVSLVSGSGGTAATTTLTYTVAPNSGGARSTPFASAGPTTRRCSRSTRPGIDVAFTMTDPNNGPGPTTTCLIRSTATPCVFSATGTSTGPQPTRGPPATCTAADDAQPDRHQPELHSSRRPAAGPDPRQVAPRRP